MSLINFVKSNGKKLSSLTFNNNESNESFSPTLTPTSDAVDEKSSCLEKNNKKEILWSEYYALRSAEYDDGFALAKIEWEKLPLFPIRVPNAVCCPICASTQLDNQFLNYFVYIDYEIFKKSTSKYADTSPIIPFRGTLEDQYAFIGLETMKCKCITCKYEWKMKIVRDVNKLDCINKTFCSYCGSNYDRNKYTSCPGCGGKE